MAIEWECMDCGYIYKGTKPPHRCPDCGSVDAWEKVEYIDEWRNEEEYQD